MSKNFIRLFTKKIITLTLLCLWAHEYVHSNENDAQKEQTLTSAYFNLAQALEEHKQIDKALENYQQILERDPLHVATLIAMGNTYLAHTNKYDKAIALFEKRLKIDNNCEKTHRLLANALLKQDKKNRENAISHYKTSIQINPKHIQSYTELIHVLLDKKDFTQAIVYCKKALDINPDNTKIRETLVDTLTKTKDFTNALKQCDILLKKQKNVHLLLKKANIFIKMEQFKKALPIFEALFKTQPHNMKLAYNVAYLYKKTGAYEKAIVLLNQVTDKIPDHTNAILSLAHSYLSLGYYKKGWHQMRKYNTLKKLKKRLETITQVSGKTILIQGEFYAEDMIQLIRYAQLLKDYGAKSIIVQTPEEIAPLFSQIPYIDKVLRINKDKICPFDLFVHISSLPSLFETTIDTIPCNIPYLYADKSRATYWHGLLSQTKTNTGEKEKIQVGIYLEKENDIPLDQLMQIANNEHVQVHLLSHAKDNCLKLVKNTNIVYTFGKGFAKNSDDICELCAIIPTMDLLITNDSFVAHLSGALGIPTWVMLQKIAGWHYVANKKTSNWYPSMRLFWQEKKGTWAPVVNAVLCELQQLTSHT